MAMSGRFSSKLALISKVLQTDALVTQIPALQQTSEVLRNYATATGTKEAKVRVPLALFGGSGNYASALYIAAAKANVVEKVEAELLDLADASARSPMFSQFTQDLSVPRDTRLKAIEAITAEAKFTDITKNFVSVLAHNGRLRHIDTITKRFVELTMAHKGEVSAIVTTVIPLPSDEEKQLKETLQEIIGQRKKVKLTQKIDPSILGGLVVEFSQKVFDMSIRTRARQMERFLRDPIDTL
ncbi:hypothetical protein MKX01_036543 [Papaver californicum]|nr:hypothetical protein MKX01_036543 [Papaver californicum]